LRRAVIIGRVENGYHVARPCCSDVTLRPSL
jgi:hypothetical protein